MIDSWVFWNLLDQIPQDEQLDSVYTDGAYDIKQCVERQAHVVISLRKNAKSWKYSRKSAEECNELLITVKYLGKTIWKKWLGYHRRSLVDNKMHFIPWSLYLEDIRHNFVLADDKCNSQKSNYAASE